MKKRPLNILSIILSAVIIFTALPAISFAQKQETEFYGHRDSGYSAPEYYHTGTNNMAVNLPSSFDGRTAGFPYTPIKNQGKYGTCWAHATLAATETAMLRRGASSDINLSELQLAEATYSEARDAMGLLKGDAAIPTLNSNTPNILMLGGNFLSAVMSMNRGEGAVSENMMDYTLDAQYTTDEDAVYTDNFYYGSSIARPYTVQVVKMTSVDDVKSNIMKYGIGVTAYYHSSSYYNTSTGAYNSLINKKVTNHEIAVIGWDDNYSKDNFSASSKPSSNGAWLVRNSWGENYGQNGYIWISYEEYTLDDEIYFIDAVSADIWDNNYQYDGALAMASISTTKGAANIYTAKSHEYLKAACISVLNNTNVKGKVSIYKNPSSNTSFPFNDTPVTTQTFRTTYPGIYTIEFDDPAELYAGDDFAVYVIFESFDENEASYDCSLSADWGWLKFNENTENDRSFIFMDRIGFPASDYSMRIKAFTVNADIDTPKNLSAELNGSNVNLSWTDTGADSYEIFEATDLGEFSLAATVTGTNAVLEADETAGLLHMYKVRAVKDGQKSAFCNARSVRFDTTETVTELSIGDITAPQLAEIYINASLSPTDANDKMTGYTIADGSIASVTPAGKLTTKKQGTTTVTAITRSGAVKTTFNITVTDEHIHQPGPVIKENIVNATCSVNGSYDSVTYCLICRKETSRQKITTDMRSHTTGTTAKENIVNAQCTVEGSYDNVTRCTVCKTVLSSEHIITSPTGHTAAEAVIENAVTATCTSNGSYDSVTYCAVCGDETARQKITTDMLRHISGAPAKENIVNTGCLTDGSYDNVTRCEVCKTVLSSEHKIIFATGHTAAEAVTENVITATCTKEGSYDSVVYCKVCNEEISRTAVPVTVSHIPGNKTRENEISATCTEKGYYEEVILCTVCENEISRTPHYTAFLPHRDGNSDGICDMCDKIIESECAHLCHKGNFLGFLWKIINFFNRMFNVNPICDCGEAHW